MWAETMQFLPAMTGNGLYYTTYKHGDDWGMVQMTLKLIHSMVV